MNYFSPANKLKSNEILIFEIYEWFLITWQIENHVFPKNDIPNEFFHLGENKYQSVKTITKRVFKRKNK